MIARTLPLAYHSIIVDIYIYAFVISRRGHWPPFSPGVGFRGWLPRRRHIPRPRRTAARQACRTELPQVDRFWLGRCSPQAYHIRIVARLSLCEYGTLVASSGQTKNVPSGAIPSCTLEVPVCRADFRRGKAEAEAAR